jgi:hypothetical protein
MRIRALPLLLAFPFVMSVMAPIVAAAQTPTVTATCKDGTAFSGTSRSGACRGHGGVKAWGNAPAAAAAAPAAAAPATATQAPSKQSKTAPQNATGQVWVNTASGVYHCPSDRYYGKTKQGSYMSEVDAKAKGFHPDHGKACTS